MGLRSGGVTVTEKSVCSGLCSRSASTGGRIPWPGRALSSRTRASHQRISSASLRPSMGTERRAEPVVHPSSNVPQVAGGALATQRSGCTSVDVLP
jgi:hypothetical protein